MISYTTPVSFKGKYIVYGSKENSEKFKHEMQEKKGKKFDDYYSLKFFNSDRTVVTEIYATDKDAAALKKSVESPEFKEKFKTFDKGFIRKLAQISDYVFNTHSQIRIHKTEDVLKSIQSHFFDFKEGYTYGETSIMLDGTKELFSKNRKGRTLTQKLKDGTIKETYQYDGKGCKVTYTHPDGTLEEYEDNILSRVKNKEGQEIFYWNDSKIRKIIEKDGTKKVYYDNGQVRTQTNPDGEILNYNENGILTSRKKSGICVEKYTKSGAQIGYTDTNGLYSEYYKSGRIKSEKDAVGNETYYYPNGSIKLKKESNGNFEYFLYFDVSAKKPHFYISNFNESKIFDREGNEIKANISENNGEINVLYDDGIRETYDEKGVLTSKTFSDGKIEEYYEDKKIKSIQLPDGTKKAWYIDGEISLEDDGQGNITEFYQDGRIKSHLYRDGSKIDYYDTETLKFKYWRRSEAASTEICVKSHEITKDGDEIFYSGDKDRIVKEILADGTERNYDKKGKIADVTNPDGIKAFYKYNDNDELICIKFSNGAFQKFRKGKLYYEKEADGTIYRIFDDYKLKIEPTEILLQDKRNKQWIAAYRSLVTTLAWQMSDKTRNAQAGTANGIPEVRDICEKEKKIRLYKNSVTFSVPYENPIPENLSKEEEIQLKKFFKQSWTKSGTDEYSIAMLLSHQIFLKLIANGIDSIEDKTIRKAIKEWIKENPEKSNVLF